MAGRGGSWEEVTWEEVSQTGGKCKEAAHVQGGGEGGGGEAVEKTRQAGLRSWPGFIWLISAFLSVFLFGFSPSYVSFAGLLSDAGAPRALPWLPSPLPLHVPSYELLHTRGLTYGGRGDPVCVPDQTVPPQLHTDVPRHLSSCTLSW